MFSPCRFPETPYQVLARAVRRRRHGCVRPARAHRVRRTPVGRRRVGRRQTLLDRQRIVPRLPEEAFGRHSRRQTGPQVAETMVRVRPAIQDAGLLPAQHRSPRHDRNRGNRRRSQESRPRPGYRPFSGISHVQAVLVIKYFSNKNAHKINTTRIFLFANLLIYVNRKSIFFQFAIPCS